MFAILVFGITAAISIVLIVAASMFVDIAFKMPAPRRERRCRVCGSELVEPFDQTGGDAVEIIDPDDQVVIAKQTPDALSRPRSRASRS